jgi:hypothetical protein
MVDDTSCRRTVSILALRCWRSGADSPLNEGRFRRLRTLAHGFNSSPVVPETVTRAPSDFSIDKHGAEGVQIRRGSYEIWR